MDFNGKINDTIFNILCNIYRYVWEGEREIVCGEFIFFFLNTWILNFKSES